MWMKDESRMTPGALSETIVRNGSSLTKRGNTGEDTCGAEGGCVLMNGRYLLDVPVDI